MVKSEIILDDRLRRTIEGILSMPAEVLFGDFLNILLNWNDVLKYGMLSNSLVVGLDARLSFEK